MTHEFRAAKNTIRAAVAAAPRPTVESILEAARGGRVPWFGAARKETAIFSVVTCGCVSQRLRGSTLFDLSVSTAYFQLATLHKQHIRNHDNADEPNDPLRQKLLIAICRADLRRRDRAMVKALVESAEPSRRELLEKAAWSAPTLTLLLAASALPTQAVAGSGAAAKPEPSRRAVPQWLQRHPTRRLWKG